MKSSKYQVNTQAYSDISLERFNPHRAVYSILGSICKKPSLLLDEGSAVSEDFASMFHRIVFCAINDIVRSDRRIKEITAIDIDNNLSTRNDLYLVWEKNDGFTYMSESIINTNIETYSYSLEILKKNTVIRKYVKSGIDVRDLFDFETDDLKVLANSQKNMMEMTNDEIVDHYSSKAQELSELCYIDEDKEADFMIGDGMDDLLKQLNEHPDFGAPFACEYYNAIFRGMRQKCYMLRSGSTGGGKTRHSLEDLVLTSMDEMYDIHTDKWEPNGQGYASLFISTELIKKELQTCVLAIVSGVNEAVIKDGHYSSQILKRLNHGIEVMKRSPFYFVCMDDFSISDIENKARKYIHDFDVKFVAFDYIQAVPKLARTLQAQYAMSLREDQIIVQLSASLKKICNKYGIYLVSSTQLNRNIKDDTMRDSSSLRGGSSSADKCDLGIIILRATGKDITQLQEILDATNFDTPDMLHVVYKNRGGVSGVIIWQQKDMGNMRGKGLFVTDLDYNLITNIKKKKIEWESIDINRVNKTTKEEMIESSVVKNADEERLEYLKEAGLI